MGFADPDSVSYLGVLELSLVWRATTPHPVARSNAVDLTPDSELDLLLHLPL